MLVKIKAKYFCGITFLLIMELTEKIRLELINKMDEISKSTREILQIEDDPEKVTEIKKRMTTILSLIRTIASFSKSRNADQRLWGLNVFATHLFYIMNVCKRKNSWSVAIPYIDLFCNVVNSIRFDLTGRHIEIKIPKIDISFFKQILNEPYKNIK